jgi:hypothetical protein
VTGRVAALLLASGTALADGAFPDELQVFAPGAAPHTVILGANFGVVQSSDDGAHWTLVCESLISGATLVTQYQLGPDGSLFAIAGAAVERSSDQGCSWASSNAIAGSVLRDMFVDPLNAQNVWAIADGFQVGAPNALYLSPNGGAAFGAPSYVEPAGYLDGIEASHSEGVALGAGSVSATDGGNDLPYLLRTSDLGATWARVLHPELGARKIGIAQVDPANDQVAYLRLFGTGLDALAVTPDRGTTVQVLLELPEAMSAFALGGDGTLYVGAKSGHLWVRAPGATAFALSTGPMFRCLAERAGTLYACGDDLLDGFALGTSTDRGATFQRLLRLQDINALAACDPVQRQCTVSLQQLEQTLADVTPGSSSGGSTGGGSSTVHRGGGCGCASTPGLGMVLVMGGLRRRATRRRGA